MSLLHTKKARKSYRRKQCGGMEQGVALWLYWSVVTVGQERIQGSKDGYGHIRKGHSILYSN